jgi:Alpha-amylase/alpha-mannosidase
MKNLCLFFQIHQPLRLKRYRFFDIGRDHYYYDDFQTEERLSYAVENSYIKANNTLLEMIRGSKGKFRCAFAISGVVLEQLEQHAPEVIDSFKELAATGSVEFIAQPFAHSLASVFDENEFRRQVKLHTEKIEALFGKCPASFMNTEMIYSDEIGEIVSKIGFKTILVDEAKHILSWKSPNYVYKHSYLPKLKVLVRNQKFSDDIAFRFSQLSLDASMFISQISSLPEGENIVTVGMAYETLGITLQAHTGVFDFLKALPYFAMEQGVNFVTPAEITQKTDTSSNISVPYPYSWIGADKNLTAWTANDLQQEALNKLYAVSERVRLCSDKPLQHDWLMLQISDHFRFMNHSDPFVTNYESAYDAFTNYMNVLADFLERVDAQYPTTIENEELNALLKTINNQEKEIEVLEKEIQKLKKRKVEK